MTGYESGKFKTGDQLPTGETFIGETEDGSPLWSEPVPSPAPKPGSTVEDALAVLTELVNSLYDRLPIENDYRDALSSIERHVQDMDALVLDMGELLRRPVDEIEEGDAADVLARLSRLGAGDSNQNEKEQT